MPPAALAYAIAKRADIWVMSQPKHDRQAALKTSKTSGTSDMSLTKSSKVFESRICAVGLR